MSSIPGWQRLAFEACLSEGAQERRPSIPRSAYQLVGRFPIIDQGEAAVAGYTDDESFVHRNELPVILFGDHTRVLKFLNFPFATGADGTKLIFPNAEVVDPLFFYFALKGLRVESRGYNRHYALLKAQHVFAPKSLEEQRAIAFFLSRLQAAADIQDRIVMGLGQLRAATMNRLCRDNSNQGASRGDGREASLPHWPSVRMGDVAHKINYGTSVRCESGGSGRPVLRIPNVIGGRIATSEMKFAELPEEHAKRVALEEGDLLFVRTNGNKEHMGRCAIYRGAPSGALFASYLLAVRLDAAVMMPEFVQAYLMAGGGAQIIANARPSADGKYNINSNTLRDIVLPHPPLEEQARVSKAFQKMTADIDVAEFKLKNLTTLFNSSLHNLMAGRIRI